MKTVIKVNGMSCGNCVKHVTNAIQAVPGVSDVEVSLESGIATFDRGEVSIAQIIEAIEEEGYEAQEA